MQGIFILGMPQYSVCPGGCRHVADALLNGNPISVTSAAYPGIYPKSAVVRPSSSRFMRAARGPEVTMLEDFLPVYSRHICFVVMVSHHGVWEELTLPKTLPHPSCFPPSSQPQQDMSWLSALGAAAVLPFWERKDPGKTSPLQPSVASVNLSSVLRSSGMGRQGEGISYCCPHAVVCIQTSNHQYQLQSDSKASLWAWIILENVCCVSARMLRARCSVQGGWANRSGNKVGTAALMRSLCRGREPAHPSVLTRARKGWGVLSGTGG